MRIIQRSLILLMLTLGISYSSTLSLDDSWVILDEDMNVGDYFSGSWTWSSPSIVRFRITDLFVISDRFEVHDFGSLVLTTPSVPDWPEYSSDPFGPPSETDPDAAFASDVYSKGIVLFSPGSHSVTIRDLHIPNDPSGLTFPDGTVAFSAIAASRVPEPSTVSMLAAAGCCLAFRFLLKR